MLVKSSIHELASGTCSNQFKPNLSPICCHPYIACKRSRQERLRYGISVQHSSGEERYNPQISNKIAANWLLHARRPSELTSSLVLFTTVKRFNILADHCCLSIIFKFFEPEIPIICIIHPKRKMKI